jgi:hypothetical protein
MKMIYARYGTIPNEDTDFFEAVVQAGLIHETIRADPSLKSRHQGKEGSTSKNEHSKKDKHKEESAGSPSKRPSKRKRDNERKKKKKTSDPVREKRWLDTKAAFANVDQTEVDKHKKDKEDCWRCGRSSHRTLEYYASKTVGETDLPAPPEKVSAVKGKGSKKANKKKDDSSDSEEETPPPMKKVKVETLMNRSTPPFQRFVELSSDKSESDF